MNVKKVLTVVIPTLNNTNGLTYLLNYFKNTQYEIVVVDNKKKNLGFAGGVNKGAMNVKTKWMLILNDDIEFENRIINNKSQITSESQITKLNNKKPNMIEYLIKYAEEKKFDAVSPILRNPDGEVENYGYRLLSIGKIELIKEIPRNKSQETNIDGITAACLLVKTEIFKKLGGFDEKFFAYLEDVDFFLRLATLAQDKSFDFVRQNKSFGIAYDAEVLHNHMTTSKTMGNFKARQDMINWWRLFFKHPEKFKFNLDFIIERLRNVSGYLKATFKGI